MTGHRGVRAGTVAFALGLSLAGPQCLGLATADSGDAGAPAGSARASQSPTAATVPGARRSVSQTATAAIRTQPPARAALRQTVGSGGDAPIGAPLAWTALAASRREIGGATRATVASGAAQVTATTPATVQSISLPSNGIYGTGKTGKFTLNFDQPVDVQGDQADPKTKLILPIQVGFAMLNASYVSGSGTNKLVFQLSLAPNADGTALTNYDGAINIGRVSNQLVGDATYPVRIFDFNGLGHAITAADTVTTPKIVNAGTNIAVSDTIPTVNTDKIVVDTRGPAVVSYGNNGAFTTQNGPLGITHWTTLTVNFDQPVQVKGAPTIPVTIGGVNDVLTYATGSGTTTITFTKMSFGAAPGQAAFRTDGQIIDLPTGADIVDQLGNSVAVVLGDFQKEPGTLGKPLEVNGNHIVVLGAYYQKLGTITAEQLTTELQPTAVDRFYAGGSINVWTPPPGKDLINPASWWAAYTTPKFGSAVDGVDLYRVAYNSTIPEQNNRPTLAYGLVAIPIGATGALPVVSYQHGAVIDKGTVPSQSFNWRLANPDPQKDPTEQEQKDNPNPAYADYLDSYETRLNVAQFGGQGYAVMAADYFGVGNSLENDGYISKASQQQACLDMYNATVKLLEAQGHPVSDLFLGGWSQGGLVTLDFMEKLQSRGIPVTGAGTASAPGNVQLTSNAWYFNPRPYTSANQANTPDDIGLSAVGTLSNFSITGYAGYTASPLQMLGVNYEAARAVYMREFNKFVPYVPAKGGSGFIVERDGLADAALPFNMQQLIAPQYSGVANAPAFAQTNYAQLLASSGAGQIYLSSALKMWFGLQDQAIPTPAGTAVYDWQTNSFGSTQITEVPVTAGNHRGTFLYAVYGELGYFDGLKHKAAESL